MDNPYRSPTASDPVSQSAASPAAPRRGASLIRLILYLHLFGLLLMCGFGFAEMRGIHPPLNVFFVSLMFVAVGSVIVCPLLMLPALAWARMAPANKLIAFVAESLATAAHVLALLPAMG